MRIDHKDTFLSSPLALLKVNVGEQCVASKVCNDQHNCVIGGTSGKNQPKLTTIVVDKNLAIECHSFTDKRDHSGMIDRLNSVVDELIQKEGLNGPKHDVHSTGQIENGGNSGSIGSSSTEGYADKGSIPPDTDRNSPSLLDTIERPDEGVGLVKTENRSVDPKIQKIQDYCKQYTPIICIDFDGVIHKHEWSKDFSTWYNFYEIMPGAKDSIWKLKNAGFRLVLFSNRKYGIVQFLVKHGIDVCFDQMGADFLPGMNPWRHNPPESSEKPIADFYIDDKDVFCQAFMHENALRIFPWGAVINIIRMISDSKKFSNTPGFDKINTEVL